jgi:D-alanyl-D-alanine carboxypeptidase/D-alanyl-D-alanine-endopeptidase (penicillin-binding protein 4)
VLPLLAFAVANSLDSILDNPKLAGAVVTCTVTDESGAHIYERNSATRVMPGSNQKLLSNSFALYKLGADYQPETKIWKFKDRVVVDSPGDPMMTHERLEKAGKILKLDKTTPVELHEAYRPLIGPSWEWDDLPNKYAAPVTAFTVDRGSIEVWAEGEHLTLLPFNYGLKAQRGDKTGKATVVYDPIRRTMVVNGELPLTKTRLDTLALDEPDKAAASFLGKQVRFVSEVPKTAPALSLGGPLLRDTIKECLVHSDNNIAENLLLMAAARERSLGNEPYKVAEAALSQFLTSVVGAEPGDFHPEDGSGLSRHDLVTTRGIVRLLNWAAKQASKDVWFDALAKPGAGTLGERLKGVPFVGKTGTLDMVVALSGYVHTVKNRTLTVSLILNHFICGEKEARAIADEFIKKLVGDDGFGTLSAMQGVYEARTAHPRPYPFDGDWNRGPRVNRMDAR